MTHFRQLICILLLLSCAVTYADEASKTFSIPPLSDGSPAAGKRVKVTTKEYEGTKVHHVLHLPADWSKESVATGRRWPVIAEYTGNKYPRSGSSGKAEDAGLGYAFGKGEFIWVSLPYVSECGTTNAPTWWGDDKATVDYAKVNIPRICETFGGNPEQVFLCGFSRGAIGIGYLGLHDDDVASLWCGLFTHDHFDGVKRWRGTTWGSPLEKYQTEARERIRRWKGKPLLVSQNGNTKTTRAFLQTAIPLDAVTFLEPNTAKILGPFPNDHAIHPHTDRWLLKPSPERDQVWRWVESIISPTPASRKPL